MDAKLYIYQQILSSGGHPLPGSAIRNEDLVVLLQTGSGPGVNGNPQAFFNRLSVMLQRSPTGMSMRFKTEIDNFMCSYLPPGRNLARAFLALPSAGISEQCYNMLIGHALDGYDRCMGHLLQQEGGRALRAYQQQRLCDLLMQLLRMPAGFPEASRTGIIITCRVKVALCVLMHRLYTRAGVGGAYHRPPFDVAALLMHHLQEAAPNEAGLRSAMQLFFTVAGMSNVSPATGILQADMMPAQYQQPQFQLQQQYRLQQQQPPVPWATQQESMPGGVDDEALWKLAGEVRNEMLDCRMLIEQLKDNHTNDLSVMRRINSREAMKILGVSAKKLQRLRNGGKLPYLKVSRTCTYLLTDVLKLLRQPQLNDINPTLPDPE